MELAQHLAGLVDDGPEPLPEHLARLGLETLERVVAGDRAGGDVALDLLAADAFVTYAFEAQAMLDIGGLDTLARHIAAEAREAP